MGNIARGPRVSTGHELTRSGADAKSYTFATSLSDRVTAPAVTCFSKTAREFEVLKRGHDDEF